MTSDEWWVVKWLLNGLTGVATLVGGLLSLRALIADRQADTRVQDRFEKLTGALQASSIRELPSQLIAWLVSRRDVLSSVLRWMLYTPTGALTLAILGAASIWFVTLHNVMPVYYFVGISVLAVTCLFLGLRFTRRVNANRFWYLLLTIGHCSILIIFCAALWSLLSHFESSNAPALDILAIAIISVLSIFIVSSFRAVLDNVGAVLRVPLLIQPDPDVHLGAFAIGASASVGLTVGGLFLGDLANVRFQIQPTGQLMLMNLVFDSMTMSATVYVFQRYRIEYAFILTIALSAVFGCSALYLGLWGGYDHLSFAQVLRVFSARTPDGTEFFLGQPFWVLHTTFIPIILFLTVLFVAILGKGIVSSFHWIAMKVAKSEARPHTLIAATFAMFVIVLQLFATAVGFFEDMAKRDEQGGNRVQYTPNAIEVSGNDSLLSLFEPIGAFLRRPYTSLH